MNARSRFLTASATVLFLALALRYTARIDDSGQARIRASLADVQGEPHLVADPIRTEERLALHAAPELNVSTVEVHAQRPFEAVFRDLVAVFTAGSEYAEKADSDDLAPDFHGQAEDLFEELIHIPQAPEEVVVKLSTIDPLGPNRDTEARFHVVGFALELSLKRVVLDEESDVRLHTLVGSLLDQFIISRRHASLVHSRLKGRGYLGAIHEPQLIDLLELAAGDLAHLRRPALDLLIELWSSLQSKDGYQPQQLASLIDDDSAMGEAALLALLLTDEFRNAVVDRVLLGDSPELIPRVAEFAASELNPIEAASTLERLNTGLDDTVRLSHAYALLASRSPRALVDSYLESLSTGRSAEHRLDSVIGLTSYGGDAGAAIGRRAFEQETDALIRSVALVGLGGERDGEFVDLFEQALADPTLLDSSVSQYLVVALRNYSLHDGIDSVFVEGARDALAGLADLDVYSRSELDRIGR